MNRRSALPDRVLVGAAYYAEYSPYPRLEQDLDLMVEAGITVIRVGESVWSTWEPSDGAFDLDWLQPVLDAAHARGIRAVLGTPTYAIPPWLARRYPEVVAERSTGRPIPYGRRQDADYSNPTYRRLAERVIRAVVGRYAGHPAVIGYQVDNEPGAQLLHNDGVFAGFRRWLQNRYGSVEELNRRWNLTYWSHRVQDWEELWRPEGNSVQGYDLEWRRYQASLTTDFIGWQADLVRSLARPDQFVTTCLQYARPAADDLDIAARLDITGVNPYYAMQDAFARPRPAGRVQGRAPWWSRGTGVWSIALEADLIRGASGSFLVTETDAGAIGEMWENYPAYDGQWRQAAWTLVGRGARLVEYWQWHTLHHGDETYWVGVLGHSLTPGRTYAEVSRIGAELARAGSRVVDLVPDVDVAFLRDADSRWALEFHPPIALTDRDDPDRDAYETIFRSFFRGFHDAGIQAAVIGTRHLETDPADLAARYPVLVVPALYIAPDEVLDRLEAYAAAGGHLVLTFRSGYADEDGTARHDVMPGRLRPSVGASYLEFSNLAEPLPVTARVGSPLRVPRASTATAWVDGLEVDTATVLAGYQHAHFGRWAAITTNPHGRGRVTYVGTLPDDGLIAALAGWAVPRRANAAWADLPPSVTVTGATNTAGEHLSFVSNWSFETVAVTVPHDVRDLLSGERFGGGSDLALTAWDVRVVSDCPPEEKPA